MTRAWVRGLRRPLLSATKPAAFRATILGLASREGLSKCSWARAATVAAAGRPFVSAPPSPVRAQGIHADACRASLCSRPHHCSESQVSSSPKRQCLRIAAGAIGFARRRRRPTPGRRWEDGSEGRPRDTSLHLQSRVRASWRKRRFQNLGPSSHRPDPARRTSHTALRRPLQGPTNQECLKPCLFACSFPRMSCGPGRKPAFALFK